MMRMLSPTFAVALAAWIPQVSMAAAPGPAGEASPVPPQGIYGGENAPVCAWPTAVELGGCTGTLVHPEVVIYAGHCGSNVPQVYFGESVNGGGGGRTVPTQFCRTMPGWQPGAGTDFAVCKLAQPVTDVQITPILMGCETEVLTSGREVVLVGFGQTQTGSAGVKKQLTTTLDHIVNDEAWLGGGGDAPCYGDSGGPAFVKLAAADGYDDTWRVFGVTSHGDDICGSGGYYGMMHNAISWFESETGVDITPCHDADGTWNPTEGCQRFPMDPGSTTGSWDDWCTQPPVGGASQTCGDASSEIEPDEEPPTVRIETPLDGDAFDGTPGATTAIEITVTAADAGDGVAEVALRLGDTTLPADATAPYVFGLSLPDGSHTISATAVDLAGNASAPDSVTIVIGEAGLGDDDGGGPDGGDGDDSNGDDAGDGGASGDGALDDDASLPPGFGQNGGASACAVERRSPTPWIVGLLVVLLGVRRRRSRTRPARSKAP